MVTKATLRTGSNYSILAEVVPFLFYATSLQAVAFVCDEGRLAGASSIALRSPMAYGLRIGPQPAWPKWAFWMLKSLLLTTQV